MTTEKKRPAQSKNEHNFKPVAFSYEGKEVNFNDRQGTVMVNATQMGKLFKKQPKDWLRLKATEDFLNALNESREADMPNALFEVERPLVEIVRGGTNQGTWMQEDVALEFSRWLSPAFAIWTNKHIKELLLNGRTALNQGKKGFPALPPKRNHNRLTQGRLVNILADVAKIENKELRLSLIEKLGV